MRFQSVRGLRFSENLGDIMTENLGRGGIRPEYKIREQALLTRKYSRVTHAATSLAADL